VKLSEFLLAAESTEPVTNAAQFGQFDQTRTAYPSDQTVPRLFFERATETPEAIAVVCGKEQLTYQELNERSNQLARFLVTRDLQPENAVAILLGRSPEMIVATLGVIKAGGAYLPLSPDLPVDRLRDVLCDSGAPVLITDRNQLASCRQLKSDCPGLKTILILGDAAGIPVTNQPGEFDAAALSAFPHDQQFDRSQPGMLAYVIYTSGTTGEPKGVMVEHQSILRLVLSTNYIQLDASDRILQTGELSFDASTFEIWGALLNGGRLYLAPREALLSAFDLAQIVKEHRITVMFLTTGLFNALASVDSGIFDSLKTVLVGGERASTYHVNRVRRDHPGLVLINVYGPTENTTFTTSFEIREEFATDVPIGRPIANTSVYILDERLEPVPTGMQGELYAGGDGLARGYLNDPMLTSARFIPNPFEPGQRLYRTGDLARWSVDRNLEFLGRIDEQIKIRGYRIEPGEIEARLRQHKHLKEALVMPRAEKDGERQLVAYYIADGPLDKDELRFYLRQKLPEYMVPSALVQLEKFPLTGNGKIDRTALLKIEPTRRGIDRNNGRPLSATETELMANWREVLCQSEIGIDDNFFELGGHSLRAVKLMYLIHQKLGVLLPFTVIFEASTVSALAARVLDAVRFGHQSIDQPMVALNQGSGSLTLFAFPPGTGDALGYGELATRLDPLRFFAFNFIEAESRIAEYADMIMKVDGTGPYVLFGYSGGGNLAFRTAVELEHRGKRVKAVVMLDSSRFLDAFRFPIEEAQRLASEFVGDEGVQAYVDNPVLKDKVIRMIERYYDTLASKPDEGLIEANVHLIVSDNSQDEYRDDGGRLICSKSAWAEATRNEFTIHSGSGEHGRMLHQSHLEANAGLLRKIFESVSAGAPLISGKGL